MSNNGIRRHRQNLYSLIREHCGTLHNTITLSDRQFICPSCGFSEERDLKASKTILFVGQSKRTYTPTGHRRTGVERVSDFISAQADMKQPSVKHKS